MHCKYIQKEIIVGKEDIFVLNFKQISLHISQQILTRNIFIENNYM